MMLRRAALVGLLTLVGAAAAQAQLGPPPLGGTAVVPSGATAARPLAQKLSDSLSLLDFGAVCNGTTDDSAAVQAAAATGRPITIPAGKTCNAPRALGVFQGAPGLFVGPGKLVDASGTAHPPVSAAISADPNPSSWNATTNSPDNCVAGFNCGGKWNFAQVMPPEEWYLSDSNGGHTLGQPVHGYEYKPGAIPRVVFFNNTSGWNNSTSGNDGRTGAVYSQIIAQQGGQGDMILHEGELLCSGQGGQPTGAGGALTTSWLANPGCAWEAGDISALTANQYLQHSEWHFNDTGHDVAVRGRSFGYSRNFTGTPGMNNNWVHDFATCNGAVACDAAYMAQGKWRIGLDLTEITTQIDAAVAMVAGQKIYLNGSWGDGETNPAKTHLGTDWLTYDSTSSTVQLADGGAPVLQLSNPGVNASGAATAVNHMAIGGNVTGGPVVMSAVGSDNAILMIQADKGGAGILSVSNGTFVMKQTAPANGNSYLELSPGGPGQPYTMRVQSFSPTDLNLIPAGNGATHPVGVFRLDMGTPASSTAACSAGQTTFDSNFQYFCVAANTWKRAALSSF